METTVQHKFRVVTHVPDTDWMQHPYVKWQCRDVPFARTEYLTGTDAVEAVKTYDPSAIFICDATDDSGHWFLLYVGCKGTYLVYQDLPL